MIVKQNNQFVAIKSSGGRWWMPIDVWVRWDQTRDLLERRLKPVWLLVVTVCNGTFYLLDILLTTTLKRENHLIFFIYFVFQAVDQGRIYALRYELCDGLARSPDLTDKDPRREMWNFFSPIALFASKPISKRKSELLPVAIQMDFTPGIYDSTFSLSTKIYTKNNWNLILQPVKVKCFLLYCIRPRVVALLFSKSRASSAKKRQINGKRKRDYGRERKKGAYFFFEGASALIPQNGSVQQRRSAPSSIPTPSSYLVE